MLIVWFSKSQSIQRSPMISPTRQPVPRNTVNNGSQYLMLFFLFVLFSPFLLSPKIREIIHFRSYSVFDNTNVMLICEFPERVTFDFLSLHLYRLLVHFWYKFRERHRIPQKRLSMFYELRFCPLSTALIRISCRSC